MMKELRDKVAFITGGASGLGLGMAKAFGREGMKVMIADIEQAALTRAVQELKDLQVRAEGVLCDVSSRGSLREAALKTIATFGKIHVVCNNAGVGAGGQIGTVEERDWQWVTDVNLLGVVYGMEVFAPLIESHGEGGHFVNTASMAGMVGTPGLEPYCASKFAVVGISETLFHELAQAGSNVGVSVLCPGYVATNIASSQRNRPGHLLREQRAGGDARVRNAGVAEGVASGMEPAHVADAVLRAIYDNQFWVVTHPELLAVVRERNDSLNELRNPPHTFAGQ
jgi:short-subunit dehydrogenase